MQDNEELAYEQQRQEIAKKYLSEISNQDHNIFVSWHQETLKPHNRPNITAAIKSRRECNSSRRSEYRVTTRPKLHLSIPKTDIHNPETQNQFRTIHGILKSQVDKENIQKSSFNGQKEQRDSQRRIPFGTHNPAVLKEEECVRANKQKASLNALTIWMRRRSEGVSLESVFRELSEAQNISKKSENNKLPCIFIKVFHNL